MPGLLLATAAREILLPKPTLYVYDSFDRADNATSMGSADSGQAWTNVTGVFGISGNGAYLVTDAGEDVAIIESGAASCVIGVTLNPVGAASHRLLINASDTNNYFLLQSEFSTYKLYKRVGGGFSGALISFGATLTNGDRLLVVKSGSYIAIFVNGVYAGETIDSFNSTVTTHGIGGASNTGAASRWQDFFVASIRDLELVRQLHRQGTPVLRR